MRTKALRRSLLFFTLVLAAAFPPAGSHAADFYKGKQITVMVGFSAGGTYDATARLFARHLGQHLAGNPTVIVQNMPGAGSMVATMKSVSHRAAGRHDARRYRRRHRA